MEKFAQMRVEEGEGLGLSAEGVQGAEGTQWAHGPEISGLRAEWAGGAEGLGFEEPYRAEGSGFGGGGSGFSEEEETALM